MNLSRHLGVLTLGLATLLAGCAHRPDSTTSARWWKGNLHTHSLWSDGDDYPEMIAGWKVNTLPVVVPPALVAFTRKW